MTQVSDLAMEDVRWGLWRARGRADDLRFRRKLRSILADLTAVIALGGALWFAFQF